MIIMQLYDRYYNKYDFDFDFSKYIGHGKNGDVYKLSSYKCIKVYQEYYDLKRVNGRITKEVFYFFREVSLDNFVSLCNDYYDDDNEDSIRAFTMKYYPSSKTNILEMPTEYVIDNFKKLLKSIEKISENNILIKDLMACNVIIGDDNMTVIDVDDYQYVFDDNRLYYINVKALFDLFISVYRTSLMKLGLWDLNTGIYLDELFKYDKEPVKALTKRFSGVSKSIDLFK